MGKVLTFPNLDLVAWGKALRDAREEQGLTLRQAATALEISPITVDNWEQGRKPQLEVDFVVEKYKDFKTNTESCWKTGNNLLLGAFPLRVARGILGLSAAEMAEKFDYSHSSWTKIEANARILPDATLRLIEDEVVAAWNSACGNSSVLRQ